MKEFNTLDRTTLIHHIEENLWETWSIFGTGPNCTLHQHEDALWFETPLPIIPYNGVLRFQVQEDVGERINEIVEHFRRRKSQFMWIVHPSCKPWNLRERLLELGLKDIEPIYGMARNLAELPEVPQLPEGIEIHMVTGAREASAFYQFAAWRWHIAEEYQEAYQKIMDCFRFGKPGSETFMWQAWRGGKPVAKAGMHLGSGEAGIYAVVTKPEARRLGLATALTFAALHHAREAGYQLAVLHSTPMAQGLYRDMGFETIAEMRLFGSEEVTV